MLRRLTLMAVLLMTAGTMGGRAQAPPKQGAGEPKTIWFFYTVKWGGQDEFLDLFQRNHYPILKARRRRGCSCRFRRPCRRTTATAGPTGRSPSSSSSRQPGRRRRPKTRLSPSCFRTGRSSHEEEQRRFELLVAHWDVPLNRIDLDTRKPSR